MENLFISPILLEYSFLNNLTNEAISLLNLKLDDKGKKEFKKSLFFNFNRYLTLQIDLMDKEDREKIYEDLAQFIEDNNEEKTIELLTVWKILPEAKEDFLKLLKNIKK
ncbi:hypothetical protein K9M50_03275 [Patescibacteria group bacterium]|nr:hypothetical protein [Patescibacteria group bacterium]